MESGAAPLELVEVDGGALSELLCAPNPVADHAAGESFHLEKLQMKFVTEIDARLTSTSDLPAPL